jgi:hypothetical protein
VAARNAKFVKKFTLGDVAMPRVVAKRVAVSNSIQSRVKALFGGV